MRATAHQWLVMVLLVAMSAPISIAQNTTPTPPSSQSDQGVGQDVKNAGHSTKKATKKAAHKTKKKVKKGANKAAQKTSEGANKVQEKTAPDQQ